MGAPYLEQRKRGQETNFQFLAVRHAVFLRTDEVEEDLCKLVQLPELLQTSISLRFCLATPSEEMEILSKSV